MTEAEFLSQYMLPDEERKRLLLGNVLLGIGGGLMSGKRGNEIGALGTGAVVGAQMGQQAISDAQRGQIDKLKLRQTWQEGEDKRRAQEASQQVTADISRLFTPQNPTENMPSRAPTVENAANIPAKRQKWEIYLQAAEKAALGGDMAAAKHWAELAEKHKPKFSTTPHIGNKEGKVGNFVLDDMGNEKQLSFAPPPEFLTFDDGKTKQVRNKYLMPESGMDIAMQTTPGQDQSNATTIRGQNMVDARSRESNASAQAPAWVNDLDRGIQIDPRSGQSRPITANGAPVGAKGITKQSDQSKTALTIITEAEKLIDKSTGSYLGAGVDQAARVFGSSTKGAEASAQLQALEGALMLNQPRMEGPQSDKDTMIYKQMAGKIGDPTVPNPIKKAALATIKVLHKKYSTGASVGGATGGWSIEPAN